MLRGVAASYTTAIAAFLVMTALHLRWLHRSTHAGDVLSAYGAGLVVLGVLVGSRPYLRAGVAKMIEASLPGYMGTFLMDRGAADRHRARVAAARPEVTLDVWAERVIAVAVVVAGTLLNGWGSSLARRWHWPVQAYGHASMWTGGHVVLVISDLDRRP